VSKKITDNSRPRWNIPEGTRRTEKKKTNRVSPRIKEKLKGGFQPKKKEGKTQQEGGERVGPRAAPKVHTRQRQGADFRKPSAGKEGGETNVGRSQKGRSREKGNADPPNI